MKEFDFFDFKARSKSLIPNSGADERSWKQRAGWYISFISMISCSHTVLYTLAGLPPPGSAVLTELPHSKSQLQPIKK